MCGSLPRFNTAFVDGSHLVFEASALDGAAKRRGLSPHFKLEVYLREVAADEFPEDEDGFSTESDDDDDEGFHAMDDEDEEDG